MKVIVYHEQKKFTVQNVSIADVNKLKKMLQDSDLYEMTLKDLQLYNFRITSTRGMIEDVETLHDEDLEKEVAEGIVWNNETVN